MKKNAEKTDISDKAVMTRLKPKPFSESNVHYWAGKMGWNLADRETTHLLLDGGKLHVPIKENEEFCRMLGDNIRQNVDNFVTELRTPVFKMHTDLDVYQLPGEENELTEDFLQEWIGEMQSVIRDFFEPEGGMETERNKGMAEYRGKRFDRLTALVCTSPVKYGASHNGALFNKYGVHIVWPWLLVHADQALLIRTGWIQHFERRYGKRHKDNIWEDVFDLSVYRANGLRMVGSAKMNPCPCCKNRRAPDGICKDGLCDGTKGRINVGRRYRVTNAVDRYGQRNEKLLLPLQRSPQAEVLFTSIRSGSHSITAMNPDLPEWYDERFFPDEPEKHKERFGKPTKKQREERRARFERLPDNQIAAQKLKLDQKPKVPRNHRIFKAVQRWIRNDQLPSTHRLPDIYRNVEIMDITKFKGKRRPYYVVRIDSLFCLNKGSEHNRSSAYFLINERGLYQKCFCTKATDEGRQYGPCSTYRSSCYRMPNAVAKDIYPEYYRQKEQSTTLRLNDLRSLTRQEYERLLDLKIERLRVTWDNIQTAEQHNDELRYQSKRS